MASSHRYLGGEIHRVAVVHAECRLAHGKETRQPSQLGVEARGVAAAVALYQSTRDGKIQSGLLMQCREQAVVSKICVILVGIRNRECTGCLNPVALPSPPQRGIPALIADCAEVAR